MSHKVYITNKQNTVKVPSGLRILIRRSCHAVLEAEQDVYKRQLRYCAVILVFCAGAWAGAVLAGAWGVHAVWALSLIHI